MIFTAVKQTCTRTHSESTLFFSLICEVHHPALQLFFRSFHFPFFFLALASPFTSKTKSIGIHTQQQTSPIFQGNKYNFSTFDFIFENWKYIILIYYMNNVVDSNGINLLQKQLFVCLFSLWFLSSHPGKKTMCLLMRVVLKNVTSKIHRKVPRSRRQKLWMFLHFACCYCERKGRNLFSPENTKCTHERMDRQTIFPGFVQKRYYTTRFSQSGSSRMRSFYL